MAVTKDLVTSKFVIQYTAGCCLAVVYGICLNVFSLVIKVCCEDCDAKVRGVNRDRCASVR